jgi:hypothetical protein
LIHSRQRVRRCATRERRPTAQIVSHGVEPVQQFGPDGFAIETNQFQKLLVGEQVWIRRLGTYLAQRKLRFKQRSGGTSLLVEQLRDFAVGEHDDRPDALEMALRLMIQLWNGKHSRPSGPHRLMA